jgi:adenylylsulfate kinase-like enzyme
LYGKAYSGEISEFPGVSAPYEVRKDFRAALGFVRLAESSMTAAAYLYAGLYTTSSMALIPSRVSEALPLAVRSALPRSR